MAEPLDIVWSRPLPEGAQPSTVTVSQDAAGRWFVSLLCDDADRPAAPGDTAPSVSTPAWTAADPVHRGEDHQPAARAPRPRALARAQRELARKQKGSDNRAKARRRSPGSTPGSPTGAATTCTS